MRRFRERRYEVPLCIEPPVDIEGWRLTAGAMLTATRSPFGLATMPDTLESRPSAATIVPRPTFWAASGAVVSVVVEAELVVDDEF